MNNIAICLLCVEPNDIHINFLNRLYGNYTKFMLCDKTLPVHFNTSSEQIQYINIDDNVCSANGYHNSNLCIPKNPSAWDKAFYYFCEINNSFDYVWLIEDDVFIPSIYTISNLDEKYRSGDLLSKSNGVNTDGSIDWYFWNLAIGKHSLPWYCSMACACRLSKHLFSKIKEYVDTNKTLFFIEIMINTIAMSNELSVITPIEFENILPKPPIGNRHRKFIPNSNKTIWIQNAVNDIQINYLYHPWKDIQQHDICRK